jgi:hypothetical protein
MKKRNIGDKKVYMDVEKIRQRNNDLAMAEKAREKIKGKTMKPHPTRRGIYIYE